MSRIDPQFGKDFRPGRRLDHLKGDQPIRFTDAGHIVLLSEHQSDFNDVEAGRKTARGIINDACIAMVFWAIVAAIVLLVWGV
jgi:hypothetical protein